jgi:RNA polymerase sigma-70 factor (ECF subfamily)
MLDPFNIGNSTTRPSEAASPQPERQVVFATTQWTVVLTAGRGGSASASAALERLCQTYWYPLYGYVRRCGHSPEDSQDLTQAFFARLLGGQWIGRADREKGKFRSFLLSALKCFLADDWDRARAKKRGGGVAPLPLQFDTAETRFGHEPVDNTTPEQLYERRWALALLEEVLRRLASEYAKADRESFFAELKPCLVGDRAALSYSALAVKLGVSESALKSMAHRMRLRYRELLREEIANTVGSPAEVDAELRHLFGILGRG